MAWRSALPATLRRRGASRQRQPPQPRGAGHQAFRHQDDDGDEDRAEQEIPALDVAADHVLDDDHQRRADDRPEQVPAPPEITISSTSAEAVSASVCGLMNWV